MGIPTVLTPRLALRPWQFQDSDALHAILQEEAILQYFPNPTPPSIERVQKYFTRQLNHWQERGYGHWAVTLPETGEVLGWCGLEFLPELAETELAYLLSRRAWGQGLATEAARAALQFGFKQAGLAKIIALVHPDNAASTRVIEKCGLAYQDTLSLWGIQLKRYASANPASKIGTIGE